MRRFLGVLDTMITVRAAAWDSAEPSRDHHGLNLLGNAGIEQPQLAHRRNREALITTGAGFSLPSPLSFPSTISIPAQRMAALTLRSCHEPRDRLRKTHAGTETG